MIKPIHNCILFLLLVSLSGCFSTPKSDTDAYHEMKNGTVYKSYSKASASVLKPVVKQLNKELEKNNKHQNAETHVHALLGLIWIAVAQPKFALAESEQAEESAHDPHDRYAALTLKALAMHEKGWHFQAKQISLQAKALVEQADLSHRYDNILLLAHVGGSVLALMDGEIPFVVSEFRSIGQATNQPWLIGLSDATDQAYNGATDKAISKLEEMKGNPDLSEVERNNVEKVLEKAKKGGNDVVMNMAKAGVAALLEDTIRKSDLTNVIIGKLPEKYRDKLAGYQKH